MNSTRPCPPALHLACLPYHLYTHKNELARVFEEAGQRGWRVSMVLPFTTAPLLERMHAEAQAIGHQYRVEDFTCRKLLRPPHDSLASRALRAVALLGYFARAAWWIHRHRPDAILMTSDLGGISVRFVQMIAARSGVLLVTLQTTLFMRVAEREDLKFELKPAWLHRLLSLPPLKRLFLFFGEVPGSFHPDSHVFVQDDEIRAVCMDYGKRTELVTVVGSMQAALIGRRRLERPPRGDRPLEVLFLTECVEERFGADHAMVHVDWLAHLARHLPEGSRVRVRFHPRESEQFRAAVVERVGSLCEIDREPDPTTTSSRVDVIVGSFSMLMFDAQSANVPVVFLDVGIDPIGFYGARRTPMVNDGPALLAAVLESVATELPPTPSTTGDWAGRVVDLIAGLARKPR